MLTPQYNFRLVTTDKPKEWLLHDVIKRHFRAYNAPNRNAALSELAENLTSEFGNVDSYTIEWLSHSACQINIGRVLVAKFSCSFNGYFFSQDAPQN